jgi:hypothetical protein
MRSSRKEKPGGGTAGRASEQCAGRQPTQLERKPDHGGAVNTDNKKSKQKKAYHRLAGNFTQVPNALIEDGRLPADAKAVCVWILSRPPKQLDGKRWVIRQSVVAEAMRLGEKTTRRIFRQLLQTGYLLRHGQSRTGGKWGDARYMLRRDLLQEYVRPGPDGMPTVGRKEAHGANPHGTGTSANGCAGNPHSVAASTVRPLRSGDKGLT